MEKRIDLEEDWALDSNESRIVQFAYSKQYDAFEPDTRKFTKTACCEEALDFAATIRPQAGKRIILVSALGEVETWGDNKKADAFPRKAILGEFPSDVSIDFFGQYLERLPKAWGYKCFPTKFDTNGHQIGGGNTFNEHINRFPPYMLGKPPNPSDVSDTRYGYILASFWNQDMRRVEVIQEVWESKAPDICKALDAGFLPGISMACDIPFDRCSVCGHLAPTEADYCIHLAKANGMRGAILKAHRSKGIYMINDFPDFFDSSLVKVRAATEAGTLTKIASLQRSYYVMDNSASNSTKTANKGTIERVEAPLTNHLKARYSDMITDRLTERPFSHKTASALREVPIMNLCTILGSVGIYPTGEDFARLLFNEKNASVGFNADYHLLEALTDKRPLTLSRPFDKELLPELGLLDKTASIPLEEWEYVLDLVEPYLPEKSHLSSYKDLRRMKSASVLVDLSIPFNNMDDKSKTIILLKIFTDKGLMERIHNSLVTPLVNFELEKHGVNVMYNSDITTNPVFGDLATKYIDRKKFYR